MTFQAPHIWVPRLKIIEAREPVRAAAVGLGGRFRITGRKADGRSRLLADWFPNLLLDSGLDAFGGDRLNSTAGDSGGNMAYCHVGSGTDSPAVGDTALQTLVEETKTIQAVSRGAASSAPYYGWILRTFRFAEGDAAGNLAEVGIGPRSDLGPLTSRARILDGAGNPTTITVLSDEILDVDYEFRLYPPASDLLGTIDLGGGLDSDLVFDYTVRACQVNDGNDWGIGSTVTSGTSQVFRGLHPYFRAATGYDGVDASALVSDTAALPSITTYDYPTAYNLSSYGGGSYYRDLLATWGLNNGNFGGGVVSAYFNMGQNDQGSTTTNAYGLSGWYGLEFSPAIPKDDTKVLELSLRASWARKTL